MSSSSHVYNTQPIDFKTYVKENCLEISGDDLSFYGLFYPALVHDLIQFLKANPAIVKVAFEAWIFPTPNVGNELAKGLATLPWLTSIKIKNSHVSDGAEALATFLPYLTYLDLSQNNINSQVAIALANNRSVEYLNLEKNYARSAGVIAFSDNTTLKSLNLNSNRAKQDDKNCFRNFVGNKNLKKFSVVDNDLDNADALYFAQMELEELVARSNNIGDEGVIALTGSPFLYHLDLGVNPKITDACVPYLASNNRLTTIGLSYCQNITSKSTAMFLQSSSLIVCKLDSFKRDKASEELMLRKTNHNKHARQLFITDALRATEGLRDAEGIIGSYLQDETLTPLNIKKQDIEKLLIETVSVYVFSNMPTVPMEVQQTRKHIDEIKGGNSIFIYPADPTDFRSPSVPKIYNACFIIDGMYKTRDQIKLKISLGERSFVNSGRLSSQHTDNFADIVDMVLEEAKLIRDGNRTYQIRPGR
jgi:hypothetical protein